MSMRTVALSSGMVRRHRCSGLRWLASAAQ